MTNANDPINPIVSLDGFITVRTNFNTESDLGGLTKREYFAAMAMQAVITNAATDKIDILVTDAVKMADALIFKLNQEAKQ